MTVWGDVTESFSNLNLKRFTWSCGGPASLTGQQLDSIVAVSGVVSGTAVVRASIYGNGVEDLEGATLIEDLGTINWSGDFAEQTWASSTNPTGISDFAFLFLVFKSDNVATTLHIRGDASNAEGNISESYDTFSAGTDPTVAFPSIAPDPTNNNDPGSLQAYINHSDAAAAGLTPRSYPRGAMRGVLRGVA